MDIGGLNYIDYVVLAVVGLSTFFGFMRGFIGSLLSLIGWIASIYLAYVMFPLIKPLIEEKISNQVAVLVIGHTALLVGFLILFGIANILMATAVKGLTSGFLDRVLGSAFGVIRGVTIVSLVFFGISTSFAVLNGVDHKSKDNDHALPKWLAAAKTLPMMQEGASMLAEFVPENVYTHAQDMYSELSKKSADDRFVDSALQKLRQNLAPETVRSIDNKLEDIALTRSTEEIRYAKLRELVEAYEKNPTAAKSALSDAELKRLHSVMENKKSEIEQHKVELH